MLLNTGLFTKSVEKLAPNACGWLLASQPAIDVQLVPDVSDCLCQFILFPSQENLTMARLTCVPSPPATQEAHYLHGMATKLIQSIIHQPTCQSTQVSLNQCSSALRRFRTSSESLVKMMIQLDSATAGRELCQKTKMNWKRLSLTRTWPANFQLAKLKKSTQSITSAPLHASKMPLATIERKQKRPSRKEKKVSSHIRVFCLCV